MKAFHVYILQCSDNTYYTGVTSNLEKRLQKHIQGFFPKCYTYTRRPVRIMFCEEFSEPYFAIQAEKKIKGWSRAKKEALIAGDFTLLHQLAECKNQTHHKNYKK